MFRSVIIAAARSRHAERLVETTQLTRGLVGRFVAGESVAQALVVTQELVAAGLAVTLDRLDSYPEGPGSADRARDDCLSLVEALSGAELTPAAEIIVRLSDLGLEADRELAYRYAHEICARASEAGTTVTLDAEDERNTDLLLDILARLRADFPTTGIVVRSRLRRAEADCRELAAVATRVRLTKGECLEPESVAFQARSEIDRSFVRCMNILFEGCGYPMIATHDERLIAIAEDRSAWFNRSRDSFEFHLFQGLEAEQRQRLTVLGYTVRVYLPFGPDWYAQLLRRMARHPDHLGFVLRTLRTS